MTAPLTPDRDRRLAAKRNNERTKVIATSLNAIALAIFGAAFVVPALAKSAVLLSPGPWVLRFVALAQHYLRSRARQMKKAARRRPSIASRG